MEQAPGARRCHAGERRQQILEAATRVFSARGHDGASIRGIAREVGVTEGLLYHYFAAKESLLRACWHEHPWSTHMERALARARGRAVDLVLRDVLRSFLDALRRNAPMVRIQAHEKQHKAATARYHLQQIENPERAICGFLEDREAAGELREDLHVPAVVALLMGTPYSFFLLWSNLPDDKWNRTSMDLIEHGVDIFLHGASRATGFPSHT